MITQPQRQECFYLSIPGFELSDAKVDLDILALSLIKIPTKILNQNFINKLLPIDIDSNRREFLENKIHQDVGKFLSYSYANKKSIIYNGGTVDSLEFDTLQQLAMETAQHAGPIIEIGTLFGYSTMALAIGKNTEKPLYTVDAFTWNPIGIPSWRHEEITRKSLRYLTETQNVKLIKSSAMEFYKNYEFDPPSLVFIDADHTYEGVSQDIQFAQSVNAAIICGDDFSWTGVKKAVLEHFGDQFEIVGDLWIWKRKN
jgi:predicted O-methyltransferase YrrM